MTGLGLRALYFLLEGLLERLRHLHYGVAAVLGLIGVKLVLHYVHTLAAAAATIPAWLSLVLIVVIVCVTVVTSLCASGREDASREGEPAPSRGS
jgi:tellurite resistance protein TerC